MPATPGPFGPGEYPIWTPPVRGNPPIVPDPPVLAPWTEPPLPTDPVPQPPGGGSTSPSGSRAYDGAALAGPGRYLPVLYGSRPVVPDFVRIAQTGTAYGPTVYFVGVLSEGPIESIVSWGLARDGFGGGFYGVSSPADLADLFSSHSSGLGTLTTQSADSALVGAAFVACSVRLGRVGFPVVLAKGRRLYDPRLGAWGAGVDPDPTKVAYSANLALELADLLTSKRYGGRVDPANVDWSTFEEAAAWCDETVDGEKRCEVNIQVRARRTVGEWLDTLGLHGGLRVRQVGGIWLCDTWGRTVVDPVVVASGDLVAGTKPRVVIGSGAGLRDLPNVVSVEWTDPATWTTKTAVLNHPSIEDGAEPRAGSPYLLHGLTSEKAANRAALRLSKQLWSGLEVALELMPRFLFLKPGDLLRLELPEVGLSGRDFLVGTVAYSVDRVSVALTSYDPAAWGDSTVGVSPLPGPSIWDPPPPVLKLDGFDIPKVTSSTPSLVSSTLYAGAKWQLDPSYPFAKRLLLKWAGGGAFPSRKVVGVTIINGGSGYAVEDPVSFTGGTGGGASGKVTEVDGGGAIVSVEILDGGSGWAFDNPGVAVGGSGVDSLLYSRMGPVDWNDAAFLGTLSLPLAGVPEFEDGDWRGASLEPVTSGSSSLSYDALGNVTFYSASGTPPYLAIRLESTVGVLGPVLDTVSAAWETSSSPIVDSGPVTHSKLSAPLTPGRFPISVTPSGLVVDSLLVDDGGELIWDGSPVYHSGNPPPDGTPDASTTVKGKVELATDGEVAALLAVQANDGRLSNARTPTAHSHPQSDVTKLTTDLAAKAPLASPTFTGTPAAPTATAGTSSTQIATTAFVQTALAGAGGKVLKAKEFTSGTTTWTAPTGVDEIWVTGCGGGGGGGRGNGASFGGGGGGGGAHSVYRMRLAVTAGAGYSVVVGASGAGGSGTSNGGGGGASSVGALLTLAGGSGGLTSTVAAGAMGGSAGGNGGTNGTRGENYIATYETGAQGGFGGVSFPGGYGAGGDGGMTNQNGQAGNSGYILIEWNE